MKTLSVRELSFAYNHRTILQNIEFSVSPGTICGLLGPNASGKTTLFKCLNGILTPQKGRVSIDGHDIACLSRKAIAEVMAVVPQVMGTAFSFTVLQMVVMGRAAKLGAFGAPSRKDYREAEATLAELGIEHLKYRVFNALSGGERQIVFLARALFQSPAILLLDEPTAHLDFKNQYVVLDMVRKVTRAKNLTTIITLHDPNLAVQYCEQMVLLKDGKIQHAGAVADVFYEESIESLYGMKVKIKTGCQGRCFVLPVTWTGSDEPAEYGRLAS